MRPRVILCNEVSLDSRIDWFSGDIGLYYELMGRWQVDVHLAGNATIFNPNEELPPEDGSVFREPDGVPGDTRPLLAVPDSRGQVRNWHALRSWGYWRGMIALCSRTTSPAYLEYLRARHVDIVVAGDDHVDYGAALEELRRRYGAAVVHVDSGGTLNGVLLRAGLVDELNVLVCPYLVGGVTPKSFFRAPDLLAADGVIKLRLLHLEQMRDEIVWLQYEVVR